MDIYYKRYLWKCMSFYMKNEEEICCDIIGSMNYELKGLIQYVYDVFNIDAVYGMILNDNNDICDQCNEVVNIIGSLINLELIYFTVYNGEHITCREYYEYLK